MGFFFFLNILIPDVAEKIFWFWWRGEKSDSEFLSYNLMLNSGKKIRACNKYSNSRAVRKKQFWTKKKP